MSDAVEIEIVGGLARAIFRPGCSTGSADDTRPGVGFDLVVTYIPRQMADGTFYLGCGVIGRQDAERLRNMLEIFLKSHARGEAA